MRRESKQGASSRWGSGEVHEKVMIQKRSKRMHKTWENLGTREKRAGLAEIKGKSLGFFFLNKGIS